MAPSSSSSVPKLVLECEREGWVTAFGVRACMWMTIGWIHSGYHKRHVYVNMKCLEESSVTRR
jgi:hypothetical protein